MPYLAITSRRMPYDIDGTAIGYGSSGVGGGVTSWVSSSNAIALNNESLSNAYNSRHDHTFWFFFPEKREIEHLAFAATAVKSLAYTVYGSNDTTNGMDGTWEACVFPNGAPLINVSNVDSWRSDLKPVSFSEPKKVLRIGFTGLTDRTVKLIHIYGRKASGETPEDILICDASTGNELTALMDWGDRPEGTTVIKSFKIKNTSTTKIANNVNLQLDHADFLMSFSSSGPWQATLDISSIPPNSLSAEIFVRNALGPPLLTLGPKAARVIATVGSLT